MLHECAWCNAEQGRKPTPGATHGICYPHKLAEARENVETTRAEMENALSGGEAREIARCARALGIATDYLNDVLQEQP